MKKETRRFGPISIFEIDGYRYQISSLRYTYKQVDIPWVVFFLTRKTAKKERRSLYNRDKSSASFELFNKVSVVGMRGIIREFDKYLTSLKNDTLIAITAENDCFDKRISFYEKQMNRLGWCVYDTLIETFYTEMNRKYKKKVLIFGRKI